jgi:hypothetical protein
MAEEQAAESLRDTLDAAIEEVAPEPAPVEEPAPSEPAPAEAQPEEAPAEPVEAAPEEPVDEVPVLGEKPAERPPASWKGDAKRVWAELPEAARSEVVRRERQIEQTLRESSEARQIAESVTGIAQQYQDVFQRYGRPPAQVFEGFLQVERALTSGDPANRARFMAKLIQDYRIDIPALDSALAGQPIQQSGTPDVNEQVRQLLAQELAPFKQRMQMEQELQQQEVAHTIDSMAADHEKFPYFQDVRDDMADLIEIRAKRGVYLSLEQAYSIATGGNPAVQQVQQVTQQRSQALQAHETAQRAKGAAVSVAGSPATTSGGVDPANLRASISAAIDGARI